jgi:hypothetical protein
MTTIVSRLYADAKTAEQVVTALRIQGHPASNIDTIPAGSDAEAAMVSARVPEASAAAYAKAISGGNTVVVCRAPVTPFGAARSAIATLDEFDSIDAGIANQNVYVREEPKENLLMDLKVDRTHRHWATWGTERKRGLISDAFGVRTLSPYKTTRSCYTGENRYFADFIMGHLSKRKPPENAVFRGENKYFAGFILPHISRRKPSAVVS